MLILHSAFPAWRPRIAIERAAAGETWMPPVDIIDAAEEYLILVDLPGIDAEQVDMRVEEGVLLVEGERRAPESIERASLRERRFGGFRRAFELPRKIDADGIAARYENGVLAIRVPKVDTSRKIPIN